MGGLVANGSYATYYEIKRQCSGTNTVYRFYIGSNNKNDYNILRHYIYTVTIDIAGANPLDLRVEIDMTSLSVVSDIGVNWGNDCIFPFMYSETL